MTQGVFLLAVAITALTAGSFATLAQAAKQGQGNNADNYQQQNGNNNEQQGHDQQQPTNNQQQGHDQQQQQNNDDQQSGNGNNGTGNQQPQVCAVVNTRTAVSYATLQAAVNAAEPADTVRVQGTCSGSTTVSLNLTIDGQPSQNHCGSGSGYQHVERKRLGRTPGARGDRSRAPPR